jgi:hypothetical protein
MTFKVVFIAVSILVVLSLAAFAVYFLRQAADEAAATNEVERAASECTSQGQLAGGLVIERAVVSGSVSRITGSSSHYNVALRKCYVEVTSEESGEHPLYVKTLISVNDNSAVLWSVKEPKETAVRQCFDQSSTNIDCSTADQRWQDFMRN